MKNIWSHEDTKIYGCNAEEKAVIDGLLAEESSFRDNGLNPVFVSKKFWTRPRVTLSHWPRPYNLDLMF